MTDFERSITRRTAAHAGLFIALAALGAFYLRTHAVPVVQLCQAAVMIAVVAGFGGAFLATAGYFGINASDNPFWPYCLRAAATCLLCTAVMSFALVGVLTHTSSPLSIAPYAGLLPIFSASALARARWKSPAIPLIAAIFLAAEFGSYALFRWVI